MCDVVALDRGGEVAWGGIGRRQQFHWCWCAVQGSVHNGRGRCRLKRRCCPSRWTGRKRWKPSVHSAAAISDNTSTQLQWGGALLPAVCRICPQVRPSRTSAKPIVVRLGLLSRVLDPSPLDAGPRMPPLSSSYIGVVFFFMIN